MELVEQEEGHPVGDFDMVLGGAHDSGGFRSRCMVGEASGSKGEERHMNHAAIAGLFFTLGLWTAGVTFALSFLISRGFIP